MKMTRVPIHGGLSWKAFNEETTTTDDSSFTVAGLLEQINTTRDLSDYLWYSTEWVTYNSAICLLLFFLLQSLIITLLICLFIWFIHVEYSFLFLGSVVINPNEAFLRNGKYPVLTVLSAGHALHVFINGQLSGEWQISGLHNFDNTGFFNYKNLSHTILLWSPVASSSICWAYFHPLLARNCIWKLEIP